MKKKSGGLENELLSLRKVRGHFHEFKGDLPVTSGCWGDPRV